MSASDVALSRAPTPARGLSITGKISIGFAIVLVLHVCVAVMGHLGQRLASDDFATFDGGREIAFLMVNVDRDVGELQRFVQAYTFTGNKSFRARAEDIQTDLQNSIEMCLNLVPEEERRDLVRMQGNLRRYGEEFRKVVQERSARKRLVDGKFVELGLRVADTLAMVADAEPGDRDRIDRARVEFVTAELEAQTYLHRLDSSAVRTAQGRVATVREAVSTMGEVGAQLLPVLEEYDRLLEDVVQRTRSYLHLVHVVLAGEAADFLRTSGQLRDAHVAELDTLSKSITEAQQTYGWLSLLVSLVTIGLGLVASWAIGRMVSAPLRGMEATFSKLAEGDTAAEIQGQNRRDEFGAMAAAAQVFREKNEETVELLAETSRLALAREQMILKLQLSNDELESFAHIASHDLRSPLRAIESIASWLEEDLGDDIPESCGDHFSKLHSRVQRMGALLNDMLVYARAGSDAALPEYVDVWLLVDDVADLHGPPEGFAVTIHGERVGLMTWRLPLQQVLSNLLANAIKHHDTGSGCIGVTISTTSEDLVLRVEDDGPGVPVEYRGKIFEPFRTMKSRDVVEASGVGLALVKKLVTQFGGSVAMEDRADGGRGAVFVVHWPLLLEMAPAGLGSSPSGEEAGAS